MQRDPYQFFQSGGTLPPDAGSYVERAADRVLLTSLLESKFCYVLNSRQMGKSSLCVRTMRRLAEEGVRTSFVDLTRIGGKNVTPEQWYAGIAMEVARSLDLRSEVMSFWKDQMHVSPVQRMFGALREVAVGRIDRPLVVFFDEIDATRSLPFSSDEFFAAIRETYNRRIQDPGYARMTFCLLGVAVPSDLINSPTSTPFNIGERIYLQDFTLEEALPLAQGFGRPSGKAEALLRRVHYWTNGQPYLTQSLCAAVAADSKIQEPKDVDAMVRRDLLEPKAKQTNINLADVANRALHAGDLEADPEKFRANILSAYKRALTGKSVRDDEANRVAVLLKLSGMMRTEGNQLKVRNRIYEKVFDRAWVREHMPGQELRRQRASFLKGALRTAIVSAAMIVLLGRLAWTESSRRREAEAARATQERQLYIADLNTVELFAEEGDVVNVAHTLAETRNSRYRGWEWGYWNRAQHGAKEEYTLSHVRGSLSSEFSEDGKQVLIREAETNRFALIDRKSAGVVCHGRLPAGIGGIFHTPDRWLSYHVSADRTSLVVADLMTSKPVFGLQNQHGEPLFIFPNPGTRFLSVLLVAPNDDYHVKCRVYDLANAKVLADITERGKTVRPVGVSRDGSRILLSTYGDIAEHGAFQIYNTKSKLLSTLTDFSQINFRDAAFRAALSPDGSKTALLIRGRLMVWRLDKPNPLLDAPLVLPSTSEQATIIGFNGPASSILVRFGELELAAIDASTGNFLARYPSAPYAAISGGTGDISLDSASVKILDANLNHLSKSRLIPIVDNLESNIPSTMAPTWLTKSADVVARGYTGDVIAFNQTAGKQITSYDESSLKPLKLSFSPTGRPLLALNVVRRTWAERPSNKQDWHFYRNGNSAPLVTHDGAFTTIVSPGFVDVFDAYDPATKKIHRVDLVNGRELWSRVLDRQVLGILDTDDGKTVVVISPDGAQLFDANSGALIGDLAGLSNLSATIVDQDAPPNQYVLSDEFGLHLYEGTDLTPKLDVLTGGADLNGISFSPDGRRVLVHGGPSSGNYLTLLDRLTQRRLLRIQAPGRITSMCFSSDGVKLFVGIAGQGIVIYQSNTEDPTVVIDPETGSIVRG